MQILKELRNGERVPVTESQYEMEALLYKKSICYFIRQPNVVIYHLNGASYRTPQIKAPKLGGRGRGYKHPEHYGGW